MRNDLQVTTDGVAIKPGLSLGGYAAFVRYGNNETLLMADLVITEAELPIVTDALQSHGIAQTALHKHLLQQTPPVWWTHVHGMGDATRLAEGLKAALDATSIGPAAPPPAQQPPVGIDTAGVEQALGRKGTADGGLFKYSIARKDTIVEDGHVLPAASLNLTTVIDFQPVGGGRAAIKATSSSPAPRSKRSSRQCALPTYRSSNCTTTASPNNPGCFICITGLLTTRSHSPRGCAPHWTPPTCSWHKTVAGTSHWDRAADGRGRARGRRGGELFLDAGS